MTLAALGWNKRRQHDFEPYAAEGLVPGRVVVEHRTHYQVATDTTEISAAVASRLRKSAGQRSDLPGAGDFVALRRAAGDDKSIIEAVLPRATALVRKAAGESRPQLLAANVDVALIVMALDGDFNLPRLERYLALVQASGAMPVIVANKSDLSDDVTARIREIHETAPGVAVHSISALADDAVSELGTYFDGNRTLALIGSSGVGKSTLTNQLLGESVQATQEVRVHDNRGRHITTHRQLFVRAQGGAIMDTPGIRGLELWDADGTINTGFDDLEEMSLQCRFRNCQHGQEPSCALRAAIEGGQLDPERVTRFIEDKAKPVVVGEGRRLGDTRLATKRFER
jgi:ribosome biogenesis GTPase